MQQHQNKTCGKCGESKPVSEFSKNKARADGLTNYCKICVRAWRQSLAARTPSDTIPITQDKVCPTCGECKPLSVFHKNKTKPDGYCTQCKKCVKNYQGAIADRLKSYNRSYHPSYWRNNAAKKTEYRHRRRARIKQTRGDFKAEEWQKLCEQYEYRCLCCGEKKPLAADHIIPVELGGSNDISNIQPLCKPCNSRKRIKIIDYRPSFPR